MIIFRRQIYQTKLTNFSNVPSAQVWIVWDLYPFITYVGSNPLYCSFDDISPNHAKNEGRNCDLLWVDNTANREDVMEKSYALS